ncbi:hypothetical protein HYW99_00325 [Candidatus Woesearchaeota archaeon]|nr:hypothetical protein [Candidatus Woesearchaeota archaeon]
MKKSGVVFLIFLFLVTSVSPISVRQLLNKYNFSMTSIQINVLNFSDYMVDTNYDGIGNRVIFELTTDNDYGNFIFVVNVYDSNGIITNESNISLTNGLNRINLSIDSTSLTQAQFNYSIKIYNSTYSLVYRKDNILSQNYTNYEKGFSILNLGDLKLDKGIMINVTLNSSISGISEVSVFLYYNNSAIFINTNKSINNSINYLIFLIDNETIKRTHHIGNFENISLKIDKKLTKTNFVTNLYDFKDFATTSYISSLSETPIDINGNNKYDFLELKTNIEILNDNLYTLELAFYDSLSDIIEIKNVSSILSVGNNQMSVLINGSKIYDKKLNAPYLVKYVRLYENGVLIDQLNNAYVTSTYNFNDFEPPLFSDLTINVSVSDKHNYGISNISINFSFKNIGTISAFNVFTEIFDNVSFLRRDISILMSPKTDIFYQFNFTDFSDFEVSSIIDFEDFVEELNESNNLKKIIIKVNRKPQLSPVENITVSEGDKIIINLTAIDTNGDSITYSINSTKFSNNSNVFEWLTSINDGGVYTLRATASDGFINDSQIFEVVVLELNNDSDNDGISDAIDNIIGDKNSVNTSTINLTILIADSNNLSRLLNGSHIVKFLDNGITVVNFEFNFSLGKLNLTNITIDKQLPNQKGSLLFNGLKMPASKKKIMYVDRIDRTLNKVCIKDTELHEISNINRGCKSAYEYKIKCNGRLRNSYKCTYNSTINKYKVEGLRYSGIVQIS